MNNLDDRNILLNDRDILLNDRNSLNDNRIEYYEPLKSPDNIKSLLPINNYVQEFIKYSRNTIKNISFLIHNH